MLHIAGGVYGEYCMHPNWYELFGSGGRAASAVMHVGGQATLHTYLNSENAETLKGRSALEGFIVNGSNVSEGVNFSYHHALSIPTIRRPSIKFNSICVAEEKVIRFGMIEGDAIVDAEYAVYDPQNVYSPEGFQDNGSKAQHLAVVLNRHEASALSGLNSASPQDMARKISVSSRAEIVVIKMGAKGALVYENDSFSRIPAFQTDRVWKIGSGDNFVALFSYFWMEERRQAVEAAELASKATAYYCANQGFATSKCLSDFSLQKIQLSERYQNGYSPLVYLAGPFFTLAELWLVDQARNNLREMGLRVFSPYHDVGHGSADDVVSLDLKALAECDVVFAIGDCLDSGTVFEVGYARSLGKPIVLYSENESDSDKKMMLGSGCILCDDYVTSVYKTLWAAAKL